MKDQFKQEIKTVIEATQAKGDIDRIYLVACGGSHAFLQPAEYVLAKETTIPTTVLPSREFITREPKALGEHSLVVSCSHSGTTPETVAATKYAREQGALTVAFAFADESPLEEEAEYTIHYAWGPETDASDLNTGVLYGWLFAYLKVINPSEKYDRALKALDVLNDVTTKTREQYTPIIAKWASELKREPLVYSVASGINAGQAYSFAICWLQEMQWVNSSYIHSGEYFHGPFEITDFDVPFIMCEGLGKARAMDERAVDFAKKHSDKVYVIDNKDFDMALIDEDLQDYYSQIVSGVVYRLIAESFAYERGHSLDVRRYMWKLEY